MFLQVKRLLWFGPPMKRTNTSQNMDKRCKLNTFKRHTRQQNIQLKSIKAVRNWSLPIRSPRDGMTRNTLTWQASGGLYATTHSKKVWLAWKQKSGHFSFLRNQLEFCYRKQHLECHPHADLTFAPTHGRRHRQTQNTHLTDKSQLHQLSSQLLSLLICNTQQRLVTVIHASPEHGLQQSLRISLGGERSGLG